MLHLHEPQPLVRVCIMAHHVGSVLCPPWCAPAPAPQTIKETAANRGTRPGVMATLNLFLETPAPGGELPPLRAKTDIMLFFKQYCPDGDHPVLKYAGRRLVPKDTKIKVRRNSLHDPSSLHDASFPLPVLAEEYGGCGLGWSAAMLVLRVQLSTPHTHRAHGRL